MPQPDWQDVIDLSHIQDEEKRAQIAALMDWYAQHDPTYAEMIRNIAKRHEDHKVAIVLTSEYDTIIAERMQEIQSSAAYRPDRSHYTEMPEKWLDVNSEADTETPVIFLSFSQKLDYIAANGEIHNMTMNEVLRHELAHVEYPEELEAVYKQQKQELLQEIQIHSGNLFKELHPLASQCNTGVLSLLDDIYTGEASSRIKREVKQVAGKEWLEEYVSLRDKLNEVELTREAYAVERTNELREVLGKALRSHYLMTTANMIPVPGLVPTMLTNTAEIILDAPDQWETSYRDTLHPRMLQRLQIAGVPQCGITAIHEAWGERYNIPDYNLTFDERRVLKAFEGNEDLIEILRSYFSKTPNNDRIRPRELVEIEKSTGVDLPDDWRGRPQRWER